VQVNHEHRGGRLTCEAHYLEWGGKHIKGCRAVIRANVAEISFVVIRLLNSHCLVAQEAFANLMNCSLATAMKTLLPRHKPPGRPSDGRNRRQGKVDAKKP